MYKVNLINLLNTIPGERRFAPDFGCRLWNVVFEPNDGLLDVKVRNIITEGVARWVGGISVGKITILTNDPNGNTNLTDNYILYINVQFVINATNQQDSIDLVITTSI
jgi:phage baseplate assembly protein W